MFKLVKVSGIFCFYVSACLKKITHIHDIKEPDSAQRELQLMPEARKCGPCLKTKVTCIRLWPEGERERERQRKREKECKRGMVMGDKSEGNLKDETHYLC